MPKKIVFVQGSPRKKGNTLAIASVAMESALENGALVDQIDVTTLDFKIPGCIGCQKCQYSEAFLCAFDDGVAQKVATLPEYDVIVMVTPLYWWSYTAQLKIFIDRMYSLSKMVETGKHRSALARKTLALLSTAAGPMEDNLSLLEAQWKHPAQMMACRFHSCLFPNTPAELGALVNDPACVKKAKAFGKSLALD